MSPGLRAVLLGLAILVLLPGVWRVASALPPFGEPTAATGPAINAAGPAERHVANEVTAVNFDFRAFDTLGEEFMLLGAVTGTLILLRGGRGEGLTDRAGRVPGRPREPRSDAVVLVCRVLGPLTAVFGVYVALHATVSPGGGFQGGVIVASGFLLVYLGEGYPVWRTLVRSRVLDAMEGGGAALYALAGLASVAAGRPFLANILPPGSFGSMLSGGLMLVENAGVALAVTGGFGLLFLEFLEETRAAEDDAVDAGGEA